MYSSSKIMPPLWIWLLLLLVVLVTTVLLFQIVTMQEKDFASRVSYIQKGIETAGEKPVIFILGTSLTQYAIDSAQKMEACINNATQKMPVILKVWKGVANLETLIAEMPELQNTKPTLLVIEANLFCYLPRGGSLRYKFSKTLRALRNHRSLSLPYFPEERKYKNRFDNRPLEIYREGIIDTLQLNSFVQLAEKLYSGGTRILLVNFPMERSEELRKWKSPDAVIFHRNFEYLRKKVPFQFKDPKMNWDSTYFMDRAHMNQKGNKAFSKWLCVELAKELQQL